MRNKLYLIPFIVFSFMAVFQAHAQKTDSGKVVQEPPPPPPPRMMPVDPSREIYQMVEEEPSFPGGPEAMNRYIAFNIHYPDSALKAGAQGRVYVSLVVEKDGSITDVKIMRDFGYGSGAEAARVIKTMPKWKPGKMNGQPVAVKYTIPVTFRLQSNDQK